VSDASDHMVWGAAVKVPSLELVIVKAVAEEELRVQLVDVEQGRRGER
jgi:hypothetical protein